MPRARRRREITVADLSTSSDSDDLTSSSGADAQGITAWLSTLPDITSQPDVPDKEDEEQEDYPLFFEFPERYDEARSESSVLASISIVTDARKRLTREQLKADLEADLSTMRPGAGDLARTILNIEKPPIDTEDVYARESGLQYWLISEDGTKQLYTWVPFDVQETLEGLEFAASYVQHRALEVTSASKPPTIHPSRKRSLVAEEDSLPAKRSKTDSDSAQSAPVDNGVKHKREITGRGLHSWPQSRLNAWEKIMDLPTAKLPATAFSAPRHDVESHCTPYFPDHTLWREVAQRLRRSWMAQSISSYIIWSRTIRIRNALERTRVHHRLNAGDEENCKTHSTTVAGSMENISSVAGVKDLEPHDMFVCDLAEGVRHHPTGKGAQLLTRVIQHALKNEDPYNRKLKLSEVAGYAKKHSITVPVEVRMGPVAENEDKAALERHGKKVIGWCSKYTT
ncbi:hypothetical protein E8E13_006204 [Curvularia kusanoi]|uniref:Uncharacterized protein n=1 Tax=Curvularia kusanoi TaxID=90978 RepID=A0A9P4W960_CURKU|nr:hypothetical protein E8E13_006204 [Curvularia kusanoi]